MLDKNRIKLMTRMARYEKNAAPEDLKISTYYRKDYVSLNTLITALWATVGYALTAALIVAVNMETLLENLTMQKLMFLAAVAVGAYLVVLVIYCICAGSFYSSKHKKAKLRMKRYYRDLSRLGKIYMKEKK